MPECVDGAIAPQPDLATVMRERVVGVAAAVLLDYRFRAQVHMEKANWEAEEAQDGWEWQSACH